ncbi:hypothetical protein HHK36_025108 [Tetracentron sinense]|uniref:Uncharacterized protein n=1 Tax=Tetracentron sinense TaxID=13715 RepID=A0A834YPG1_TETSI|nr:hypothetical protein HHK36_025108 [Tetracentron sinense]
MFPKSQMAMTCLQLHAELILLASGVLKSENKSSNAKRTRGLPPDVLEADNQNPLGSVMLNLKDLSAGKPW